MTRTIPERINAASDRAYNFAAAVLEDPDYRITDEIQALINTSDTPGLDLVDLTAMAVTLLAETLKATNPDTPAALRRLQEVTIRFNMKAAIAFTEGPHV
jgi:hypothetical protein